MIDLKNKTAITWSLLFVGLSNHYLTLKEVIKIINSCYHDLSCDDDSLIEINVNEDNQDYILNMLKNKGSKDENVGLRKWKYLYLLSVKESSESLKDKLREIEKYWSNFGYPDEWKNFIYYMPNDNTNSEEGVYNNFLNYLKEEEQAIDTLPK